MTNEELVTNAEALYNEGEYNKVISLIKSIPQEQLTYQLQYLLALSYSDDIESDNIDDNYRNALKILKSISDDGEYDMQWLYLTGKIYFMINQEEYAIEYFDKITRMFKNDKEFADLMNMQHFIKSCKEALYERALAVVFIVLKNASKDSKMAVCNIDDNKLELFFPKYSINLTILIDNLRKSGAKLIFEIVYPDSYSQKYTIDGDADTYEDGIADALNRFVNMIKNTVKDHCK